jgi:uncharacterized protein YlaI
LAVKKQTKSWKGISFKPLPEAENTDEEREDEGEDPEQTTPKETKQIALPTSESVTDVTEITDYSVGIENNSDKTLISKSKSGNSGNTGNTEEAAPGESQLKVVAEESGLRHLEVTEEIIKFQKVNSDVESHGCDVCSLDKLAIIKQRISEEDRERLKRKSAVIYSCQECFDSIKAEAEKQRVKFFEIPMEVQSQSEEEY